MVVVSSAVPVMMLIMLLIKLPIHLLMLAITTSVMVTTMVHCGMLWIAPPTATLSTILRGSLLWVLRNEPKVLR